MIYNYDNIEMYTLSPYAIMKFENGIYFKNNMFGTSSKIHCSETQYNELCELLIQMSSYNILVDKISSILNVPENECSLIVEMCIQLGIIE